MKKRLLENYEITGSIHTIQMIVSVKDQDYEVVEDVKPCINKMYVRPDGKLNVILNPNHLFGDLMTFDDLKAALELILEGIHAESYEIIRVDMRFDSYDPTHYKTYEKLYRYLICLMLMAYPSIKNRYRTDDLVRLDQISVSIKNQDLEMEHYNRAVKSEITKNLTELAQSRFELRSKHHNTGNPWKIDDLRTIFCNDWARRLEKASKKRIDIQRFYNEILTERYFKYKDAQPILFKSVNEFIRKYQDYIFSREQLLDLLRRINVKNPEITARNFKTRSGIEYIGKRDVNHIIRKIKDEMGEFFS